CPCICRAWLDSDDPYAYLCKHTLTKKFPIQRLALPIPKKSTNASFQYVFIRYNFQKKCGELLGDCQA
ncbi:unnamed protein product, partial [Oikopleura dioica]